jgi:ubiquinone/menaquinone biosynthesis C-methylase UbiE
MNNRLLYHMTVLFIPLLGIFKPYGKNRLTKNTSKELRHTIYDWLSAKYQYHYSEKEIKNWFKENKFKKIVLTNHRTGITAIKSV